MKKDKLAQMGLKRGIAGALSLAGCVSSGNVDKYDFPRHAHDFLISKDPATFEGDGFWGSEGVHYRSEFVDSNKDGKLNFLWELRRNSTGRDVYLFQKASFVTNVRGKKGKILDFKLRKDGEEILALSEPIKFENNFYVVEMNGGGMCAGEYLGESFVDGELIGRSKINAPDRNFVP
jgi:hypothetical protein